MAIGGFIFGEGKITVGGYECCKANVKQIRKVLGAVFQDPDDQLFMPRLFDDVAFGPLNMGLEAEQVRQRTEGALETVGLAGLEDKEPHHLSAGQKRCAAIATILSMMPEIITMDEPDSNLDPRNRNNLIELLNSFDHTIIIASCSMNFAAKVCQKAVLINNGRLIAAGRSEDIMSDKKLMESHGLEVPAVFGGC
jgi:cobalt/nickel transport system ATP-binding protein